MILYIILLGELVGVSCIQCPYDFNMDKKIDKGITMDENERFKNRLLVNEKSTELELVKLYSEAIISRKAAIFIGSGISTSLKLSDWKTILKDPAESIDIDVNKTSISLPEIAQYYINDTPDVGKARLVDAIKKSLKGKANKRSGHFKNSVYKYICNLSIMDVWTTNYDDVIEHFYGELASDKKCKALINDSEVIKNIRDDCHVFVFHMHGYIPVISGGPDSNDIVISTDDYENYKNDHAVFLNILAADLLRKTFLFIGFSFEDPNLRELISRIKISLKKSDASPPTHYLILYSQVLNEKTIEDMKVLDKEERAKIKDLQRYNIRTIRVFKKKEEDHPLNRIMLRINRYSFRTNIVLAGSTNKNTWGELDGFSKELGEAITKSKNEYVLHTCYADGVGKSAIEGAFGECIKSFVKRPERKIQIWPICQPKEEDEEIKEINITRMIRSSSVCIFLGGKEGTKKEYLKAKRNRKFLIPIFLSGGVSSDLYEDLMSSYFDKMIDEYGLNEEEKISVSAIFNSFVDKKYDRKLLVDNVIKVLDVVYSRQS